MLHIRISDLRPDFRRLPEVFAIGSPSFVRVAAGNLVGIVLNHSVVYYGGDTSLAIFGVCHRVLMFTIMPIIGLVQGMLPIVGFNYGAQNMKRVRETVVKASVFATALSFLAFLLLLIFPEFIFGLFNKDARLIAEGASTIRVIVILLPFVGFQIIGASLFQAIGRAVPALFLSMSRQVLFLIPLLLILPLRFKLAGIWASFPVADLLSVIVTSTLVLAEMRRLERHPVRAEINLQDNIPPPFQ
jgi:Na+-driven multidrug efflux pump